MLRQIHTLPGLIAGVLVAVLAVTGAILSLNPVLERVGVAPPNTGQISVAMLAEAATSTHREIDRIVKTPSGSVIAYYFDGDRAAADLIDPATGMTIAPYERSGFVQFVTNLHRSFLIGDAGRAAAGIGALAMVVLAISGAIMLATRLGGWIAILRPIRGTPSAEVPGTVTTLPGEIVFNESAPRTVIEVANTGDRPIQVGSHYHFFEVNPGLHFDRERARGQRLDIAPGTAVRFEPGSTREVTLVPLSGARTVYGFRGDVMGPL